MNRIEYMTKLASLLQDIPEEERRDAMKYYNDYFDEAGKENEEQVVEELGRPEDVAANIKADFLDRGNGMTDAGETYSYSSAVNKEEKTQSSGSWKDRIKNMDSTAKIIVIVAIVLTLPVTLPIIGGIASAILGIIVGVFSVFLGLVTASVAVLIGGAVVAVVGLALLVSHTAVGLAVAGLGLILTALGLLATVGSVKLCMVAFPAIIRGIQWIWHKIVPGKAVD